MSATATGTDLVKVNIEMALTGLRDRANAIVVHDQESYILACQIALDARSYMKDVKSKLGPGIDSAKTHLQRLQNDMKAYLAPAEAIDQAASQKAEGWKAEERRKAQVEQERINREAQRVAAAKAEEDRIEAERIAKEQRKEKVAEIRADLKAGLIGKRQAEKLLKLAGADEEAALAAASAAADEAKAAPAPQVTVAPNVPKVAGIKARVNWKFKITDERKIPRTYQCADETAIGAMVRNIKNKAEAESICPGIEVYTEDSI
jgi:hypothetical protein